MPYTTTYSFADISATFASDLAGQKQVNGQGIGSFKITMTDNLTESDLGADGSVMITKIESGRGTIDLEIQQTSSLNVWLHNWLNVHRNAGSSSWADTTFTVIQNFANGLKTTATAVCPMKYPDETDQQQGQKVTWSFFCGNITKQAA